MAKDSEVRWEKLHELRQTLHSNNTTSAAWSMREYCELQIEDIKDRMLDCTREDLGRLQGEAAAFYTMLEAITESPMYEEATGE